ncbi:MAG: ABC transporter-like protein [Promethearchaeota archaeon CR_4]|nr:MAG: ABC transporter-like protein [Candidatus Lokiarchaeota archaeon CR_4]
MIVLDNVSFRYSNDTAWVLKNNSLRIDQGEYIAILGQNGAGKSTLVRLLNGLLRPTQGNVYINGMNTSNSSVAELAREVGLVFQNPDHQLFAQTVRDELQFSVKTLEWSAEKQNNAIKETLTQLDLTLFSDRSPFKLSGGEKRRTSIGTIWVRDPSILILDEPTTGQDAVQKRNLASLLSRLQTYGKTIFLVTHDIEFTIKHCPRVIILKEGQIIGDGPTMKVFSNQRIMSEACLFPPQIIRLIWKLQETHPNLSMPNNPQEFTQSIENFLKNQ